MIKMMLFRILDINNNKDQNDVGQKFDDGIFQMKRRGEEEVDTDRQGHPNLSAYYVSWKPNQTAV